MSNNQHQQNPQPNVAPDGANQSPKAQRVFPKTLKVEYLRGLITPIWQNKKAKLSTDGNNLILQSKDKTITIPIDTIYKTSFMNGYLIVKSRTLGRFLITDATFSGRAFTQLGSVVWRGPYLAQGVKEDLQHEAKYTSTPDQNSWEDYFLSDPRFHYKRSKMTPSHVYSTGYSFLKWTGIILGVLILMVVLLNIVVFVGAFLFNR